MVSEPIQPSSNELNLHWLADSYISRKYGQGAGYRDFSRQHLITALAGFGEEVSVALRKVASAHETTASAEHPLAHLIGAGLVKDPHTFYVRLTFAELGDAQKTYQWAKNYLQTPDRGPQPHPNGWCKCQYCGEGFVLWGDASVHERSCSKNPALPEVTHVGGYTCRKCGVWYPGPNGFHECYQNGSPNAVV